jgi:hypothetical protein
MAPIKPDWNNATGMQLEMVHDALLHAFPNPGDLIAFLLFRMQITYARVAGFQTNYSDGALAVLTYAQAQGRLEELIEKAQQKNPGNPRLQMLRHLGNLTHASRADGRSVEDIVRNDGGFQNVIPWIRKLDRLTAQVCRIECPINQGVGTGWLVANDLVLTNGHVVAAIMNKSRKAAEYAVRFDYATDANGTNGGTVFPLAADPVLSASPASPLELGTGPQGPTSDFLDYAVVRLAQNVGDTMGITGQKRGYITTIGNATIPADGASLIVLQHPSGDPMALDIGTVLGSNGDGTRVRHNVSTRSGSSGSPCFNVKLELVALHNAGDPLYNGVSGTPTENHAVPFRRIIDALTGTTVPRFWS